jgi:membrane-bound metal-dependent hydrolase YbcI (DUF457 family)
VFLWFIGTSVLTIAYVFRDPRFDYRPLIVGSLLPDIVDGPLGGARYAHSLLVPVALLVVVMLATAKRRNIRRRLLGVPIGMLLHIVYDGAFSNTHVFWWPFAGAIGTSPLPAFDRGWVLAVALELAGAALIGWGVVLFGLRDPVRRQALWQSGTLSPVNDG